MTNASKPDFADSTMMDLFRTELETHATTLNDGLLALEQTPDAMDRLDALMRAVHSIKGGARIVELDQIVRLAHVMEDGFVAAQRRQIRLQSPQIDLLFRGADLIREIADAAAEGDDEWPQAHQSEIDKLVSALAGILHGEASDAAAPRPPQPAAASPQAAPKNELQPPVPPASALPEHSASAPDDSEKMMREFFRSEVEIHATLIAKLLETIPNAADPAEKFVGITQALHAIKGGSQIVAIEPATRLADAMERYAQEMQKQPVSRLTAPILMLQECLEMTREIARIFVDEDNAWSEDAQKRVDALIDQLEDFSKQPAEAETPAQAISTMHHVTEEIERAMPGMPAAQPILAAEPPEAAASVEERADARKGESKDRTVRVTAAKIERLMGLAGEVVVSARWLPTYSESLLHLKKMHRELAVLMEKLRETCRQEQYPESLRHLLLQAREKAKEANAHLIGRLTQLDMFSSTSATLSDRLYHEVIGIRMRPFSDGIRGFPRMVRDLARDMNKKVQLDILGKSTEVDRDILEKLDAPLTHLLRNAVDHGIEPPDERVAAGKPEIGTVRMEAAHRSGMLLITVSDDGRGIDLHRLRQKILRKGLANADMVNHLTEPELLKFLFLPGFSTAEQVTEISGRGVGLDVVDNMVHEVGGVVRITSRPGKGVSFYLELPLTLSVIRTFLVEIAGEPYAFPLARIERCLLLSKDDLETVEDRQYFRFDDENVAMVDVHEVLELKQTATDASEQLPVVVITDRSNLYGLLVDRFIGEYDLVVRPLDARLGKVQDISAMAVMLDGSPILILDVEDLVKSVDKLLHKTRLGKLHTQTEIGEQKPAKRILVVDDSITVREMERKLLENHGYHVEVAVDGLAGWNTVRAESFDLVVSDVDMPRMNGIEFVGNIKRHEEFKAIPVIIVSYKDTEEHRLQGLEAGADYYLTKSSFQDNSFINAVVDLIGEA